MAVAGGLLLALVLWWRLGGDEATTPPSTALPGQREAQASPRGAPQPVRRAKPADDEGLAPPLRDDRATTLRAGLDAGAAADGEALATAEAQRAQLQAWLSKNAEAAEKLVDTFCDQNKGFERDDAQPRLHDAAVYLAVRVDWDMGAAPKKLSYLGFNFSPGRVQGWVVLVDLGTGAPLCQTRFTATSSAEVSKQGLIENMHDAVLRDFDEQVRKSAVQAIARLSPALKSDLP